jgi:hypothetical protein
MILDGLLTFSGAARGATGGVQNGPYTDTPTTGTQVASNVIDLGLAGLPTSAQGGGARDIGIGDYPALKLSAISGGTWAGGTSLQLQLAGAPDNGSGAPGAFTIMWTGPAITLANLNLGLQLCNVDVPRVIDGQVIPRFLQLSYISVGTWTGGLQTVEAQIVLDLDQQIEGVTGAYSGYPAGITVAN